MNSIVQLTQHRSLSVFLKGFGKVTVDNKQPFFFTEKPKALILDMKNFCHVS